MRMMYLISESRICEMYGVRYDEVPTTPLFGMENVKNVSEKSV